MSKRMEDARKERETSLNRLKGDVFKIFFVVFIVLVVYLLSIRYLSNNVRITKEYHTAVIKLIEDKDLDLKKAEKESNERILELKKEYEKDIELAYQYGYAMDRGKYSLSKDNINTIIKYSKEYNVSPHLMIALFYTESSLNPNAYHSKYSATGIGQIIPSTGKYIHKYILKEKTSFNINDMINIDKNIKYSTAYMGYLMKRYKDPYRALMHYKGAKSNKTFKPLIKILNDFSLSVKGKSILYMARYKDEYII